MGRCEICGEVMPRGEEMFKMHGYSGPCPAPPLSKWLTSKDSACMAGRAEDQLTTPFRMREVDENGHTAASRQRIADLEDALREIVKQCEQADDPEHHTLGLIAKMAIND